MHTVNLVINSQCTCRCQWCDLWQSNVPEMEWEQIEQVANQCVQLGVRAVMITGGEPSLHSRFLDILKLFHRIGAMIILCTDGVSLYTKIEDIAPWVDWYLISLDAHTRELYQKIRRVDGYEAIISLPNRIKQLNPKAKVQFSHLVQPLNAKSVDAFYMRVRQLPVDGLSIVVPDAYSVAFGHENGTRESLINSMLNLDIEELSTRLLEVHRLDRSGSRPIIGQTEEGIHHYINYLRSWKEHGIPNVKRVCTIPDTSVTFTLDGVVRPCFYMKHNYGKMECDWTEQRKIFLEEPDREKRDNERGCSRCAQFLC